MPAAKEKTPATDKLKQLRKAFDRKQIGLLPKLTCRDCSARNCTQHRKALCKDCRNFISPAHIHLDYVGHAAVTDRLLSVDPNWSWEPMAVTENGLPVGDSAGNLWIKLTVLGVTRPGVGDGANMKERIGDAIRNAAMRFGVALDLWSKEELESVTEDASLKNDKPSESIRSPAEIEAEAEEHRRMVELSDQLYDLLKSRYPAKRIRMTIEALTTVEDREKAIETLSRSGHPADEDKPIDLDATQDQIATAVDAIDLEAEGMAHADDDDSEAALLKEAKEHIVGALETIGVTNEIKAKSFIFGVIGQSVIDNMKQAELVIDAIDLAKKQRDRGDE